MKGQRGRRCSRPRNYVVKRLPSWAAVGPWASPWISRSPGVFPGVKRAWGGGNVTKESLELRQGLTLLGWEAPWPPLEQLL